MWKKRKKLEKSRENFWNNLIVTAIIHAFTHLKIAKSYFIQIYSQVNRRSFNWQSTMLFDYLTKVKTNVFQPESELPQITPIFKHHLLLAFLQSNTTLSLILFLDMKVCFQFWIDGSSTSQSAYSALVDQRSLLQWPIRSCVSQSMNGNRDCSNAKVTAKNGLRSIFTTDLSWHAYSTNLDSILFSFIE